MLPYLPPGGDRAFERVRRRLIGPARDALTAALAESGPELRFRAQLVERARERAGIPFRDDEAGLAVDDESACRRPHGIGGYDR
jgi:hypothetical protein